MFMQHFYINFGIYLSTLFEKEEVRFFSFGRNCSENHHTSRLHTTKSDSSTWRNASYTFGQKSIILRIGDGLQREYFPIRPDEDIFRISEAVFLWKVLKSTHDVEFCMTSSLNGHEQLFSWL